MAQMDSVPRAKEGKKSVSQAGGRKEERTEGRTMIYNSPLTSGLGYYHRKKKCVKRPSSTPLTPSFLTTE